MKKVFRIVITTVLLLSFTVLPVAAENSCNCAQRPYNLEPEKLKAGEYTREEIAIWADSMLGHTRNFGVITIPVAYDEAGEALGVLVGQTVGNKGTVSCRKNEDSNGIVSYRYTVSISEENIRETFISLLEAGVYCNPGTYHENAAEDYWIVYTRGDIDMDNEVTAKDYMTLKRTVLGNYQLSDDAALVADVNADGEVDARDYMILKRHVLGKYKITGTVEICVPGEFD